MPALDRDIAVVRRIRDSAGTPGCASAYAELVNRHKDKAMTLAVRILGDHLDAEEALQDAFVRAFRALDSFDERARFSTWFYRILYNVCMTRLTRRASLQKAFPPGPDDALEYQQSSEPSPFASLELSDRAWQVKMAIRQLPEQYATVVTLFYVQEMSHEEIAEVTGMPIGTIKTNLHRGRRQLAEVLRKRGVAPEHAVQEMR